MTSPAAWRPAWRAWPGRLPPDRREVRLDWPYTQSDLAAMIGGTRQSVNKLLSGFVERGLLIVEQDSLLIPDVEALERATGA